METLYKLTNSKGQSKGGIQWGPGVTHKADSTLPPVLCTAGVIHAYRSLELAAFMAPIHVGKDVRTAWVAQGEVCAKDGTKVGCRSLTTIERAKLPEPTLKQRIAFAILAVMELPDLPLSWIDWAKDWLSGVDRSEKAAKAAWAKAAGAAWAAKAAAWAAAAAGGKLDLTAIARKALKEY